jgi:hypothetical protein
MFAARKFWSVLVVVTVIASASGRAAEYHPGFACPRPDASDPLATAICADPDLAKAELVLEKAYYLRREVDGPLAFQALKGKAAAIDKATREACGIPTPGSVAAMPSGAAACYVAKTQRAASDWATSVTWSAYDEATRDIDVHIELQQKLACESAPHQDPVPISGNGLKTFGDLQTYWGPDRRRSGPRPMRDFSKQFSSLLAIDAGVPAWCRITPISRKPSGVPRRSVIRWHLVPGLPRSVGFGPVAEPPFWPRRRSCRCRPGSNRCGLRPVAGAAVRGADGPTHRPPASRAVAASRSRRPASHLHRQHLPRHASAEHKEDRGRRCTRPNRRPATLGLGGTTGSNGSMISHSDSDKREAGITPHEPDQIRVQGF